MTTAPIFATHGLTRYFGGIRAVDGVDIAVPAGEIRAIIGPNGAGKSTFFNMACGEMPANTGQIVLRGEDVTRLPAHEIAGRGVSRTMQITHVFPRLTVLDNVIVAVLAHARRHFDLFSAARRLARGQAEALLELVGLTAQAEKAAGVMAHGDQKRLELAIALAGEPSLLLLDEPTAGLARPDRMEMMDLVARLVRKRGLTLMFTEHDMDVVFSIADTVTVFHQGRVVAEGTPQAVRDNEEVQRIYLGAHH